jgi:Protein of unknown function (DUF1488)
MAVWQNGHLVFQVEFNERTEECAITDTALRDLAGASHPQTPEQLNDIFETHRVEIEEFAIDKLRRGSFSANGLVIDSIQLADWLRGR